ncbi:hypothetical protein LMG26411_00161 [Cupriavidus numazuensis]|uniref:Uncharacterized protein n=1 Tax=Cupriavidus numazuensis TaxID=221992 RepID=A0ABN7PPN1_9BURK|nr:hypothetical protein LMG26411_00161 [Cupriavidus numazuensis]
MKEGEGTDAPSPSLPLLSRLSNFVEAHQFASHFAPKRLSDALWQRTALIRRRFRQRYRRPKNLLGPQPSDLPNQRLLGCNLCRIAPSLTQFLQDIPLPWRIRFSNRPIASVKKPNCIDLKDGLHKASASKSLANTKWLDIALLIKIRLVA